MRAHRALLVGRAFLAAVLLALCGLTFAHDHRNGAVVLSDGAGTLQAEPLAGFWVDAAGSASLEDVIRTDPPFKPGVPGAVLPINRSSALWIRLRLMRNEGDHQQWLLAFPNPVTDAVHLWQRDDRGRWRVQSAGDTIPAERWPETGRYPAFRLDLPPGQVRDIYVQLRSSVPTSVPVRLVSDAAHSEQVQIESLGLGGAFGALILLIVACLSQAWAFQDRTYGLYALYAGLATLCVAAYTGIAANVLWEAWAGWADAAPGCLAILTCGSAALFVRDLAVLGARHRHLDRGVQAFGWAAAPFALLYLVLERARALDMMAAYLAAGAVLNIVSAALCWRRRDVVGAWILAGYAPLTAAVGIAIARLMGLLPVSFATQYSVVIALVLQVPLLLVALSKRSHDRHAAHAREQALSSRDALTGLLAPHIFTDRLQQLATRARRHHEDAAICYIDLVNHGAIKARYGASVADQNLLRSVLKLRKVVRDIDTLGRIGEARFGLILEGVSARAPVTDRAARLIASGLMPLQGLKPDVTLQFHVAAVLLSEHTMDAAEIDRSLDDLLASMSPRTRRPIRFVKPLDTLPAGFEHDSDLPDDVLPTVAG
jgi:diguanylate cyclase (GGDEF)-like protein